MKRMIRCTTALALVAASALVAISTNALADNDAPAMKASPGMSMKMDQPVSDAHSASPSTAAYEEGMAGMMKGMHAPYTGDADADFVSHMIPHHEGAVSMAQVERTYGKDPEMRKLALEIIKAQDKEIALMKRWQAKHAAQ